MQKYISFKIAIVILIQISIFALEAKITKIKGQVTVGNMLARVGMVLEEGQVIHAKGKKSFFIVEYNNGTRYMMRNGQLKIEKIETGESILRLINGTIFSSVKKSQNGKKPKFKVMTKTATLGVRGTKFFVSEYDKESYLCVCEGVVNVTNKMGSVDVRKNQDIHVKSGEKLEVVSANMDMVQMGIEVFKELGDPIE